jgi:hypothetical protein
MSTDSIENPIYKQFRIIKKISVSMPPNISSSKSNQSLKEYKHTETTPSHPNETDNCASDKKVFASSNQPESKILEDYPSYGNIENFDTTQLLNDISNWSSYNYSFDLNNSSLPDIKTDDSFPPDVHRGTEINRSKYEISITRDSNGISGNDANAQWIAQQNLQKDGENISCHAPPNVYQPEISKYHLLNMSAEYISENCSKDLNWNELSMIKETELQKHGIGQAKNQMQLPMDNLTEKNIKKVLLSENGENSGNKSKKHQSREKLCDKESYCVSEKITKMVKPIISQITDSVIKLLLIENNFKENGLENLESDFCEDKNSENLSKIEHLKSIENEIMEHKRQAQISVTRTNTEKIPVSRNSLPSEPIGDLLNGSASPMNLEYATKTLLNTASQSAASVLVSSPANPFNENFEYKNDNLNENVLADLLKISSEEKKAYTPVNEIRNESENPHNQKLPSSIATNFTERETKNQADVIPSNSPTSNCATAFVSKVDGNSTAQASKEFINVQFNNFSYSADKKPNISSRSQLRVTPDGALDGQIHENLPPLTSRFNEISRTCNG